jgi:hypothetical protein
MALTMLSASFARRTVVAGSKCLHTKLSADWAVDMWTVKFYTGTEWPLIKSDFGIELECAGATREQAEKIAAILNEHYQEKS